MIELSFHNVSSPPSRLFSIPALLHLIPSPLPRHTLGYFDFQKIYTESISKAHLLNVAKMWLYTYDNTFFMQSSVSAMDARLLSFFDIIFCVLQNYKFPSYPPCLNISLSLFFFLSTSYFDSSADP